MRMRKFGDVADSHLLNTLLSLVSHVLYQLPNTTFLEQVVPNLYKMHFRCAK